jgi:ribosomal protein S18 acetylase RimI-like enzyme
VLGEAERGLVDFSGLRIAVRGLVQTDAGEARGTGRVIGAIMTQPLSSRTAAVWAPEVLPSWRRGTTAAALVRSAIDDLRDRGFQLVQAVLDESASEYGSLDLTRGGFPRVTELIYMERSTASPPCPSASAWEWSPFLDTNETEFRDVLRATYRESLDMPELGGCRSIDDILADQRATGRFEPNRWRLGRIPGEPDASAILLLAQIDAPEPEAWEVVYLGLTPSARRRGLGRSVIAHALELAAPHANRLELAVDVRNTPALRLYQSTGFTVVDRRVVHLTVFGNR